MNRNILIRVGKFKPEYVSKMDFYLEGLDRQIKKPNENPSVGLLLCASKNDEVVKKGKIMLEWTSGASVEALEYSALKGLDRQIKKPDENPSVGLLLCASKNDEVVC